MNEEKILIKQFQIVKYEARDDDIFILLDNGKVYRRTEDGGPYYWKEETWVKDLIKYLGEEEINS